MKSKNEATIKKEIQFIEIIVKQMEIDKIHLKNKNYYDNMLVYLEALKIALKIDAILH